MGKLTKVRKWAIENGYKVEDTYSYYDYPAIRIIVDEENEFTCETRESTVYMSVRGISGDRGGLYLTHEYKPKDGRFHRPYADWMPSQDEMIRNMEGLIKT